MAEEEKSTLSEEAEETTEEIIEEKDPLEEDNEKLAEAEDKYLRLYAEFENYKKRTQKEKDARYADAVIDSVAEILPVLDNLDRALAVEVTSEDAKSFKEGVEMTKKQMVDSLTKLGVTEIAAVGEQFNPNLHNAVMHIDDETVGENVVVEEFMKGYIYNNDRVVRYSMVKVAN
ncbi:MAG: nucleotide exchange factor GrpE [Clostridia bacterium]|nr:nucleotide exchange factor GrpE [Clostridia bacterium]